MQRYGLKPVGHHQGKRRASRGKRKFVLAFKIIEHGVHNAVPYCIQVQHGHAPEILITPFPEHYKPFFQIRQILIAFNPGYPNTILIILNQSGFPLMILKVM